MHELRQSLSITVCLYCWDLHSGKIWKPASSFPATVFSESVLLFESGTEKWRLLSLSFADSPLARRTAELPGEPSVYFCRWGRPGRSPYRSLWLLAGWHYSRAFEVGLTVSVAMTTGRVMASAEPGWYVAPGSSAARGPRGRHRAGSAPGRAAARCRGLIATACFVRTAGIKRHSIKRGAPPPLPPFGLCIINTSFPVLLVTFYRLFQTCSQICCCSFIFWD